MPPPSASKAQSFETPFNSKESPINVSSDSSSGDRVTSSNAGGAPKRAHSDSESDPKRSLFPEKTRSGNLSFLSQLGSTPSGSTLSSSARDTGATYIRGADGTIILQQQIAVVANFKQFESYNAQGWATFIKQFRDENERVPPSSRRTATSLTKSSVREQLRDDFEIADWDTVTDDMLLAFCFERFGPKTARDAKLLLEKEAFYFNDATMPQNTFTSKLVSFFSRKITMIADFKHSAVHWDETDELSKWDITDAMINMFPTDAKVAGPDGKTLVPKSSNNKTIVALIRKHREEGFKAITTVIKKHFRDVDDRATHGQGVKYDVEPWLKTEHAEGDERRTQQPHAGQAGKGRAQNMRKNVHEIRTGGGVKKAPRKPGEKGARCCNCGKRGHRATKDDCLFWGHSLGRGAKGVWEESEKSLRLPDDDFSAWCTTRKDFLDTKKANKAKASNKSAQCSPPATPECYADEPSAGKAPAHTSEQRRANISTMGATGTTTAFHAIGRFTRDATKRAPRTARVLMDPGADVNLIRTSIVTGASKSSTLKVLNTRKSPTDLFNNGVKIGHVDNEYELEFTLDSPSSVSTQRYTDWFMAWDDLKEEVILGAAFNEAQCFTNYQKRLVPYDTYVRRKKPSEPPQDPPLSGQGSPRRWELDRRPSEAYMPGMDNDRQRDTCPHQQQIAARIDSEMKLKQRHKVASAEAIAARSPHPWMCRPIVRPDKIRSPTTVERTNHTRVDYKRFEHMQLAAHLTRSYCEKQQNLLKKLEPVGELASRLTAEEHETIVNAAVAHRTEYRPYSTNTRPGSVQPPPCRTQNSPSTTLSKLYDE
jgi:hypothetical protein